MLKVFNTLTRKIEEFTPLRQGSEGQGKVGMYTCGPTVYDYIHIGNLRSFVFSDILRRTLDLNSFEVHAVQNITDIDDKIIKKASERSESIEEFTGQYTRAFFNDLNHLNILPANVYPKATEHIVKMVKFIEVLIDKGFAYTEKDGSVYFDISKFSDYGKLSRLDKRDLKTGTRILSDEYDKDNIQDFALWKSVEPGEIGYDSPWGKGRPGWHIECSVMSQEYLGDTFDIHAGGIDLLFPHHENEIAQSQAKTGKPFVKYFIHGEHLLVDGKKMAKSLKNFYTLKDIQEKGIEPLALRYLFLTAHYRDKLNFTWESLQAAQNALNNLRDQIRDWSTSVIASEAKQSSQELDPINLPAGKAGIATSPAAPRNDNKYTQKFLDALNNDLNTSQALAVMWELIKSEKGELTNDKSAVLLEMDKVLGLDLEKYLGKKVEVPLEVRDLVKQREKARVEKDFEKSDRIRKQIEQKGFEVLDSPAGSKLRKLP